MELLKTAASGVLALLDEPFDKLRACFFEPP
jgi:hypothetical protein